MKTTAAGMVLGMVLIVAGCAGMYRHPTKPSSQRFQDQLECEALVREQMQDSHGYDSAQDEWRIIQSCMRQKGWTYHYGTE